MKKIVILILTISTLLSIQAVHTKAYFRVLEDTKTTRYVDGVRHTEIVGDIDFNGVITSQKINYLGANPTSYDDLNIVVGDNYLQYGYAKGTLEEIIWNVNERYDNYSVIGGVNGDFYGSMGIPIEAYVRNYEVISPGLGNERTVIGFHDDGTVSYGTPCLEGYELVVFDAEGKLKTRIDLDGVNIPYTGGNQIIAYFDSYQEQITSSVTKVILDGYELKNNNSSQRLFGKGYFQEITTDEITVPPLDIVVVAEDINQYNLFEQGGYALVQQKLGCGFENVRFAIGGWEVLVVDGIPVTGHTEGAGYQYRHPRTAIGIKEDGTVFFVTVDGRDFAGNYKGMTAEEMGELMYHFGAEQAFNLDGGGSTTMMLLNDNGEYDTLNTPSDGYLREISNGVFFVRGEHQEVETVPYPDFRTVLEVPNGLYKNHENKLYFNQVEHAVGYLLNINGEEVVVYNNIVALDLSPGIYEIKIRAIGDQVDYKNSEDSDIYTIVIFTNNIQNAIDFIQQMIIQEITE